MSSCIVAMKSGVNELFTEMFIGQKQGHLESFPTRDLSLCPLSTVRDVRCCQGNFLKRSQKGLLEKGAGALYSSFSCQSFLNTGIPACCPYFRYSDLENE